MTLDPTAAAARRQWALDRLVELHIGWGCPLEHAEPRARQTLDAVLDAGYTLPAALADVPTPRGGGSTPAGRTRARLVFVHRPIDVDDAGWTVCACGVWRGPRTDHDRHLAAMLVVGGVATRDEQETAKKGPARPTDKINGRSGVSTYPPPDPEAHRGAQGVGS